MRELTPIEARVLAVLVEKQATVPDTYPLSLNALLAGCNQKTARHPVMELSEADVAAAVDALKSLSLVVEVSGARVTRYEHNMGRGLSVPSQAVALLAVLMLRGPQTAAELRLNAERLHRFSDVSSVEGFLDELAGKNPARTVLLPRAPGSRESRWAHLLCGMPAATLPADAVAVDGGNELVALQGEVARQALQIARLERQLQQVAQQLGIALE